ncbi:HlyD family secretion protein [Kistimonas scapharcae]|uniref:HlyD family secretion protein n=1 Tax=Kistimonas scapharcae TaxID=1036133 RepID=A0ABP8V7R7_9GAMM
MQENGTHEHIRRNWLITLAIVVLLVAAGYLYLQHQKKYPDTDDAYIHASIIYIASQVAGKVNRVNVVDYEAVDKGDLLVQIDPAPYEAALDKARAVYENATQQNRAAGEAILAASADVRSSNAKLTDVQTHYSRTMALVAEGVLPKQSADDARADLSAAQNVLDAARATLSQLVAEQGADGSKAPSVKEAAAALTQASLNLSYTNITAPTSGLLGKVSIHPGSIVAVGQAMTPLVVDGSFWMQANFKEDDLGRIRPGMPVDIDLDMYPDTTFSGRVEAISPASGSAFSLLPPENATGNWVKIPQRFPVKISIVQQAGQPPLRVGASGTVTVDTVAHNDTSDGSP